MKKKWKKIGLILKPTDYKINWWHSYGMDPTVVKIKDSIHRIFFCGRNKNNQSIIGSADIDLKKPNKPLLSAIT